MCGATPRSGSASAELATKEVARRVARDTRVVALDDAPDHFGKHRARLVAIDEVVVVDDRRAPCGRAARACARSLSDVVDVLRGADGEALEIDEEHVLARLRTRALARVAGSSNRSRSPIGAARKIAASIIRNSSLMTGRKSICARMSRSRSMPGAISISSRPSRAEPEHAALGDVNYRLAALACVRARECAVLDLRRRICATCLPAGSAAGHRRCRPPARRAVNVPTNTTLLRVLADVDETARRRRAAGRTC